MQAISPATAKAKTVNIDVFTIVRDKAGLKEQRLGTVHPKILLNSDLGLSHVETCHQQLFDVQLKSKSWIYKKKASVYFYIITSAQF